MAELRHDAKLPRLLGTAALSRFRCVACGYGASCNIAPERCPMCGGKTWEYENQHWSADLDQPMRRESAP